MLGYHEEVASKGYFDIQFSIRAIDKRFIVLKFDVVND